MNARDFGFYSNQLEQRFLAENNHAHLKKHLIPDLINAIYMGYPRLTIKALSSYLPFNDALPNNLYALQGGGDYHILEIEFTHGERIIIQIMHIYKRVGALPRTQKHGKIIDSMIRLRYMANQPQYAGASTYMIVVTDAVLINYLDRVVFTNKLITPTWISEQRQAFQDAILPTCLGFIEANHVVHATIVEPLYAHNGENFGTCTWKVQ